MTIQQAIEKAIEGGWEGYIRSLATLEETLDVWLKYSADNEPEIFLDPLFWQSLGKSLGWGVLRCVNCHEFAKPVRKSNKDPEYWHDCCASKNLDYGKSSIGHWHDFIDHLAESKTIEDYFANLPTPQNDE